MIELRWVLLGLEDAAELKPGCVRVYGAAWAMQKLQYRQQVPTDECAPEFWPWSEWCDVPIEKPE